MDPEILELIEAGVITDILIVPKAEEPPAKKTEEPTAEEPKAEKPSDGSQGAVGAQPQRTPQRERRL